MATKRSKTASPIRSTVTHAREYERRIRRDILNPIVAETQARVMEAAYSYSAIRDAIDRTPSTSLVLRQKSHAAASAMIGRIQAWHKARFTKAMSRAFGIRVGPFSLDDTVISTFMDHAIRANVDLIVTIPQRYHAGLTSDMLKLGVDAPFDQNELMRTLRTNYQSSGYNVRRLTRDQTSKTVGKFNEIRQRQVGIERYQWSTSNDSRVRPSHVANEGQEFSWESPPEATGHPGEDVQCRCVALAVIPTS